jgi:isoquinoline 1-oxidoreductase beta subunit
MGSEPLAYRMGMLSGSPRLARCLTTAAALGGWDGGGAGSNLGLACASAFGSHIAILAEASVGSDQRLAVHRLVAAVDCGRMVNVGLIRQQVESGLLWALGQATAAELEFSGGMVVAAQAGLPRLKGTPDIRVEIVASAADPGGLSGLPALVLAPALANAVAAGTGLRLRSLPFAPGAA